MGRDFGQGREKVAPTVLTCPRLSDLLVYLVWQQTDRRDGAAMGQTKIPRHGCRSVRDGRGEGLGWCLNHSVTMRDLLQTVVDGLGPHERLGALVIEPNQLVDRRPQLRHAVGRLAACAHRTTARRVQPRGTRRRTVQMKSWRSRQSLLDRGVVVRPSLSRITWRACPGDVSRSMTGRNFSHSSWRWRG